MYGRSFLIVFLLCQMGLACFAGPLEILSKGASLATFNTCKSYDEKKVQKELIGAANKALCDSNGSRPLDPRQQLTAMTKLLRGDQEDQYFALLADQQVKELRCAGSYANQITNSKDDDPIIKEIIAKLQLARTARHNLSQASQRLATDPNVSTRVCPMDHASLLKEFPIEERDSETYQLCNEIIVNKQGYNAIVSSIGLSGTTSVESLIDKFSNESVQIPLKESESALIKKIKSAYAVAEKDLDKSAKLMNKTLQEKGGAGFERADRYALLQDPALSKTVLDRTGAEDLRGVACQADARYGSGADKLDKGILTASLILSGAAAITVKAGTVATEAFAATNSARVAGLIPFNGMKILQYSAFATDFYTAAKITDQACSDHVISEYQSQSACVSAPSLKKNPQENCILMATLSATGFVAMVPKEVLLKAGLAIAGDGFKTQGMSEQVMAALRRGPGKAKFLPKEPPLSPAAQLKADTGLAKATELDKTKQSLSDRLQSARATGDVTTAKNLEEEISSALKNGEIVHAERVGVGEYGAKYVTYADGTQGVWKPDSKTLWYSTAQGETVASSVDKYLGTNLVPVTVRKSYKGVNGTVQHRITSQKGNNSLKAPDELGFFDYLIANNDRHAGNYLRTSDGSLVAIDNGLGFSGLASNSTSPTKALARFKENVENLKKVSQKRAKLEQATPAAKEANAQELQNLKLQESQLQSEVNTYVPQKQIVEKLRNTSKDDWNQLLKGQMSKWKIASLVARQKTLLKAIDEAEKAIGPEKLYPGGNFSPLLNRDTPIVAPRKALSPEEFKKQQEANERIRQMLQKHPSLDH